MKEPFFEKVLRRFRYRRVKRHIPFGARVLDIGCGWEIFALRTLSEKISYGAGVDYKVASTLPSEADSSGSNKIKTFQFRFENEEWPEELGKDFDICLLLAVIEHIPSGAPVQRVLTRIHQHLRPGGRLILTTPTPSSQPLLEFLAYKVGIVSEAEIRDHKKYYSRKDLFEVLSSCGYKLESYSLFQFGLNSFCIAKKP